MVLILLWIHLEIKRIYNSVSFSFLPKMEVHEERQKCFRNQWDFR